MAMEPIRPAGASKYKMGNNSPEQTCLKSRPKDLAGLTTNVPTRHDSIANTAPTGELQRPENLGESPTLSLAIGHMPGPPKGDYPARDAMKNQRGVIRTPTTGRIIT